MGEHSNDSTSFVRHEEELRVGTTPIEVGAVRARKQVETERFADNVPRDVEHAEVEQSGPLENDSGEIETLPDGSVSIPVFEEEVVVTKRVVVRERVIIRKTTTTEHRRVEADVRKERLEVDVEEP
jgi:uncharacterized protein (TIGR02271 family)